MMKGRQILTGTFALILLATLAQGPGSDGQGPQSPQDILGTSFTYQGQLKSGGVPVNGDCQMVFRLYEHATQDAQVGGPITTTVPITGGLFTVGLDFGPGVFDGDARWLGISVQCTGDAAHADLGRQLLTAAPYALYAPTAGSAPWAGLTGVPGGFADGVDDVTAVVSGTNIFAGDGLTQVSSGNSVTMAVDFGGSGLAITVARSDHDHEGSYWSLTGNAGTTPGVDFVGTTDDQALELHVNSARALRLEPNGASPNLIGGYDGNSVGGGVSGATVGGGGVNGNTNHVNGNYGTVSGGLGNAAGNNATVGGGLGNDSSGYAATIGGGGSNEASDLYAAIGGGWGNTVSGEFATIGGGLFNYADALTVTIGGGEYINVTGRAATASGGSYISVVGDYASVGGGRYNTVITTYATIAGGAHNTASGYAAAIGGGGGYWRGNTITNTAGGQWSTIGGGGQNTASGHWSTIGGGWYNVANWEWATIGGGAGNISSGESTTVGGGVSNAARGNWSTIGGGVYSVIADTAYAATIGGGYLNWITRTAHCATVGGGYNNVVEAQYGTIAGGGNIDPIRGNRVTDEGGTVGGGANNQAGDATGISTDAYYTTVGGGWGNTAGKKYATVGGGEDNTADGDYATVGGGGYITVTSDFATVSGGGYNTASGYAATIGGGGGMEVSGPVTNTASGDWSVIAGGGYNTASGHWSTVGGGGHNIARGSASTVGGGAYITVTGIASTVAGGYHITVTTDYATVGGGNENTASHGWATVGGGEGNTASGSHSTVAGGEGNTAWGWSSAIGGGRLNTADNLRATVAGGEFNMASGEWSTVSGGRENEASGNYAAVPGGRLNTAQGDYSFAAGRRAKANHTGAFVWADSGDVDFSSTADDQFAVRTDGGAWFTGSSISAPLLQATQGGNADAFYVAQYGGGRAGFLGINNVGSGSAALYVTTNGTGYGVYAETGGTYAGYFMDDIYVAGSCVGCTMVYIGLNDGGDPLEAGDLVAVSGVDDPLAGTTLPLMRVRRADAGNASAVIGVVQGKADVVVSGEDGRRRESANRAIGAAAPGDYVFVVVQGVANIKADATGGDIEAGQRLTAADQPGHARALRTRMVEGMVLTEGAPIVGIALVPLDESSGTIPVLVTLY